MPAEPNPIIDRCASLAMTLSRAQQLAVEHDANDPDSLARVLGLDTETWQPIRDRRWVWMAAQGASVGYRDVMDERALVDAISSAKVESKYFVHMCTLLDEVPLQVVIMACSQVAQQSQIPMPMIWKNVATLARIVSARRAKFWSIDNY
ncbi:hypothetical protein H3H37_22310 [Duganella sp. LX20W]|uniref:Uncharacterized protein n=1 Tax=Rugamonas brunnea TaxID=2758569 RepID=A0A7W2EWA7_9BURK|nr:hypothetical protein [Rugamonas brunnea]MBA5639799.1 hypothetical protein [Rugamonas brunnea]